MDSDTITPIYWPKIVGYQYDTCNQTNKNPAKVMDLFGIYFIRIIYRRYN